MITCILKRKADGDFAIEDRGWKLEVGVMPKRSHKLPFLFSITYSLFPSDFLPEVSLNIVFLPIVNSKHSRLFPSCISKLFQPQPIYQFQSHINIFRYLLQ